MVSKNRKIYDVNEDILKRVVAGDTSALAEMNANQGGNSEIFQENVPLKEKETGNGVSEKKKTDKLSSEFEQYRERFLSERLTGARRQTYIHNSLYSMIAEVLPVIAPNMSVPTFVNNVLSDHLCRYEDVINNLYKESAIKKPVQWKK